MSKFTTNVLHIVSEDVVKYARSMKIMQNAWKTYAKPNERTNPICNIHPGDRIYHYSIELTLVIDVHVRILTKHETRNKTKECGYDVPTVYYEIELRHNTGGHAVLQPVLKENSFLQACVFIPTVEQALALRKFNVISSREYIEYTQLYLLGSIK